MKLFCTKKEGEADYIYAEPTTLTGSIGIFGTVPTIMQAMVERGYELFTSRCAEGRDMSQDSIKAIGEGRVWLGKDAVEIGLVDELGNINSAIQKAAELAGLDHINSQHILKRTIQSKRC